MGRKGSIKKSARKERKKTTSYLRKGPKKKLHIKGKRR